MPLVNAKCPNCGGSLQIDYGKRAAICPFCKEAYIVEDAINNYTNNNYTTIEHLHADVVNYNAIPDFDIRAGELIKYNGGAVVVTIPSGITKIGSAFKGCSQLKSVSIPYGVRVVGEAAFLGCKNLESVTLPDSLLEIENGAFDGCSQLRTITIPSGVKVIGEMAFCECSSLESIVLPDSIQEIKRLAFAGCERLTEIKIPSSLRKCNNIIRASRKLRKIVICADIPVGDVFFHADTFCSYENKFVKCDYPVYAEISVEYQGDIKELTPKYCMMHTHLDPDTYEAFKSISFFGDVETIKYHFGSLSAKEIQAKHVQKKRKGSVENWTRTELTEAKRQRIISALQNNERSVIISKRLLEYEIVYLWEEEIFMYHVPINSVADSFRRTHHGELYSI